MCDVVLDVGDFFTFLKRWPMNFICLKNAENNFHELDIMGAIPRKDRTCCDRAWGCCTCSRCGTDGMLFSRLSYLPFLMPRLLNDGWI